MSITDDPIAELAYKELLIGCEADDCLNVFQKSLDEPATDPVEVWAEAMADSARSIGWSVGVDGKVLCPTHGHQYRESGSE